MEMNQQDGTRIGKHKQKTAPQRSFLKLFVIFTGFLALGLLGSQGPQALADGSGLTPIFVEEVVPPNTPPRLNPVTHEIQFSVGKNQYVYPGPPAAQLEWLDQQLSEAQFEQFLEKRKWILTSLTKILNVSRLGIGMLTYTKEKVSMIIPSKQFLKHPIEYIKEKRAKKPGESPAVSRMTTPQLIEKLVQDLDKMLWTQGPIIADANEFGVNMSVGLTLEAGAASKGFGGLLISGLSFSFNRDQKKLNWEFHITKEKFKSAMGAVTPIGVVLPRMGVFARHFNPEAPVAQYSGQTIYPPVAPVSLTILNDMMLVEFDNPVASVPTAFPYVNNTSRTRITPRTVLNYLKTRAQKLWSLVPAISVDELSSAVEFKDQQQRKEMGLLEIYSCFTLVRN